MPSTLTIVTLNSSTLVAGLTESESEDLDGDGTPDNLSITIEITFSKQ